MDHGALDICPKCLVEKRGLLIRTNSKLIQIEFNVLVTTELTLELNKMYM